MSHSINATQLFIIGSHASQTMSPDLWNPVFEALGNHWSYEPRDVPTHSPMQEIRNSLLSTEVIGANVTMPHKQWAAGIADERSEQVRLSGAANLLIRQGGKLHAYNTDLNAVATKLATRMHDHVVFLGAGGAARAALVALQGHIGTVTIADRDQEAANQLLSLATHMGVPGKSVDWPLGAPRSCFLAPMSMILCTARTRPEPSRLPSSKDWNIPTAGSICCFKPKPWSRCLACLSRARPSSGTLFSASATTTERKA